METYLLTIALTLMILPCFLHSIGVRIWVTSFIPPVTPAISLVHINVEELSKAIICYYPMLGTRSSPKRSILAMWLNRCRQTLNILIKGE